MADDFVPIKKADVPLTLFGSTEVGHADIVAMENHIKVNLRIRKDHSVLAQLMEQGLVGLTIEYDGPEALHRARAQEDRRNNSSAPFKDAIVALKAAEADLNPKGLADCE